MTRFAKLLVFANLFLSLIFTGWAIGLFTQRVDWAPGRTLGGEPIPERPGRYALLDQEIADAVEQRNLAEVRWQATRPEVAVVEANRQRFQDLFAEVMQLAQTGKDKDGKEVNPPVRVPRAEADILDKDGKTVKFKANEILPTIADMPAVTIRVSPDDKVPPVPVKSQEEYDRLLKTLATDIKAEQDSLKELIDQHKKLTDRIAGVKDVSKGLQQQRDDQLAYLRNCRDEIAYLQPLLDDSETRLQVLRRRQIQLQNRIKDLQEVAERR